MPFDRKIFFDKVRSPLFSNGMSVANVAGCESIISEFERRGLPDMRWLAYMLATAFHETAFTMQPIAEYGRGRGKKYGVVGRHGQIAYGRGFVQLTWDDNYERADKELKLNGALIENYDLALKPDIAAGIMFSGMIGGWFTGKKLADFIRDGVTDFVHARKIINGLDKAEAIAGYASKFHAALIAAAMAVGSVVPAPPDIEPIPAPKPVPPTIARNAGIAGLLAVVWLAVSTSIQSHPFVIGGGAFLIVLAFIALHIMRKKG